MTADEYSHATLHALATSVRSIMVAMSGKKFDEEIITERILDVNMEPSIIRDIENQGGYYIEAYTKLVNNILFSSNDQVYLTSCALANILAKILITYKTNNIQPDEECVLRVMARILDVNTN